MDNLHSNKIINRTNQNNYKIWQDFNLNNNLGYNKINNKVNKIKDFYQVLLVLEINNKILFNKDKLKIYLLIILHHMGWIHQNLWNLNKTINSNKINNKWFLEETWILIVLNNLLIIYFIKILKIKLIYQLVLKNDITVLSIKNGSGKPPYFNFE